MGWLFSRGCSRKEMVARRTKNWSHSTENGMQVDSVCLAHCYRGGTFSGVLWAAWERTFQQNGAEVQPTERWITCDLLRYERDYGWGYKDMDESMHPHYFSCPLKYLNLVPIEQFGGRPEWRDAVQRYHARQQAKRILRTPQLSS